MALERVQLRVTRFTRERLLTMVSLLISVSLALSGCRSLTELISGHADPLKLTLPDECREITPRAAEALTPSSLDHTGQTGHTRGVFWWSLRGHPHSIPKVLRSPRLAQSLIKRLQAHRVDRVYTFAQPFLRGASAQQLKRWHRALHRAEIKPHLLVGTPVWACSAPELFELLRGAFSRFQSQSQASERFNGVYLDIEPHTLRRRDARCLYQWDQLSASEKRGLLYGLLHTIIKTRELLDDLDQRRVSLSVYLPVWLDNLNTPDRVWESATQRDQFYQCLGGFTHKVTVAAYCRRGEARITQSLRDERRLLGQKMRVGLNVYHLKGEREACQTWGDIDELWQTSHDLQRWIPPRADVDLENLTRLLDQL